MRVWGTLYFTDRAARLSAPVTVSQIATAQARQAGRGETVRQTVRRDRGRPCGRSGTVAPVTCPAQAARHRQTANPCGRLSEPQTVRRHERHRRGHGRGETVRRTCPQIGRKPERGKPSGRLSEPQTVRQIGNAREPVTVPNLSGKPSGEIAADGAQERHRARRDRDGREPVRRGRTQGRAVAALFPARLSGKPSGRLGTVADCPAARSPRAQAARLRLSPVRRRDYPANLSGKPSGGEPVRHGRVRPSGTGGRNGGRLRRVSGDCARALSGEIAADRANLSPFRTRPARTVAADRERLPIVRRQIGRGERLPQTGGKREAGIITELGKIRTADRPADRGIRRTGTPQAARRDRDGREPVRRERTQGRAVAARFRRLRPRTCPADVRTCHRPARTVAARSRQTVRELVTVPNLSGGAVAG